MPLSDDDVREILRLIDESDAEELHIETEAFSLHVERRGAPTEPSARRLHPPSRAATWSRSPPR